MRKRLGDIAATSPAGVRGPFFNDEFDDTYGSIVAFSGESFSYAEVKDYADFVRQQQQQRASLVLAITLLFMKVLSIELHKISLGGLKIALSLLVDDAIIAEEMMVRKMEEGLSRFAAATFAFAFTSTAMPMLDGTLIIVALPIGLTKSAAGECTFTMFSVNAIALLVSWVAAVMFTPYIGFLLLEVKPHLHGESLQDVFDAKGYRRYRAAGAWSTTAWSGAKPPSH